MSCCSYLIYLYANKKRQFSLYFYLFLLTLTCIFTSFYSINVFAGTSGVKFYESVEFKDFITKEFITGDTSEYVKKTENPLLSYENFKTLINELVRNNYLDNRGKRELNRIISCSMEMAGMKGETSAPPEELEGILRLLMKRGVRNGKLAEIISTMSNIFPIKSIVYSIKETYDHWLKKQGTEAVDSPDGSEEVDWHDQYPLTPPLPENVITIKQAGVITEKSMKRDNTATIQHEFHYEHVSQELLKQTIEQQAENFFKQLKDNDGSIIIDWPAMALALSTGNNTRQLSELLRYRTSAERLEYFKDSISSCESVKAGVFMKLVAIYHEAGGARKRQAKKMAAPILKDQENFTMKHLVAHINDQYPHKTLSDSFFEEGLVTFFETHEEEFRLTYLAHAIELQKALKIDAPGMNSTFNDLIKSIELFRENNPDKQKVYAHFIRLISEDEEAVSEDYCAPDSFLKVFSKKTMPYGACNSIRIKFLSQPELKENISSMLEQHGSKEQKLGVLLMTDGRINPFPEYI